MSKTYEAMVLLDNREVKKGWESLKGSVSGLFQKHGVEVVSARRWDERRLAYPIRSQLRGTYLLVYFTAGTDSLTGIRRDLEYSEPVLRHLTMQCEQVPADAFEPEAEFDESALRTDDTEPRPRSVEPSDEAGKDEKKAAKEEKKAAKEEKAGDQEKAEEPASAEGQSETAATETDETDKKEVPES